MPWRRDAEAASRWYAAPIEASNYGKGGDRLMNRGSNRAFMFPDKPALPRVPMRKRSQARRGIPIITLVAIVLVAWQESFACTSIMVGKKASRDGSVKVP
jgi:hypothetical protein